MPPGTCTMTDQTQKVDKLTEDQVAAGLESLPEWSQNGDSIQRTMTFDDFVQAMRFVNRVADEAERAQHHRRAIGDGARGSSSHAANSRRDVECSEA